MLTKCEDKEVQKAAIYRLGVLGTEEAISKVIEFIKSDDKELKKDSDISPWRGKFLFRRTMEMFERRRSLDKILYCKGCE